MGFKLDLKINIDYLTSYRGAQKTIQIALGFIICSVVCTNWYGGVSCLNESKVVLVSSLNFIIVLINIVLFVLNLAFYDTRKFERYYSLITTVVFVLSAVALFWYLIDTGNWNLWYIITLFLLLTLFFTFLWDYRLVTQNPNDHIPI